MTGPIERIAFSKSCFILRDAQDVSRFNGDVENFTFIVPEKIVWFLDGASKGSFSLGLY